MTEEAEQPLVAHEGNGPPLVIPEGNELPPVIPGGNVPVKETILKKRRRDEQWAIVRKERQGIAKAKARGSEKGTFRRAEDFVKEFRLKERDNIRLSRESKKLRKCPHLLNCESKLLFVIRIRGTSDMHPKSRKLLHLLNLKQIFTGVFMEANRVTLTLLKKVEPFVTYGYPSMNTVKDLIFKRGQGKMKSERMPLTDNAIIEKALGGHGIICIADLINEIYGMGPHFKQANAFLWPFKLSPPSGGGKKPGVYFNEPADAGNRKERINDLILQMN